MGAETTIGDGRVRVGVVAGAAGRRLQPPQLPPLQPPLPPPLPPPPQHARGACHGGVPASTLRPSLPPLRRPHGRGSQRILPLQPVAADRPQQHAPPSASTTAVVAAVVQPPGVPNYPLFSPTVMTGHVTRRRGGATRGGGRAGAIVTYPALAVEWDGGYGRHHVRGGPWAGGVPPDGGGVWRKRLLPGGASPVPQPPRTAREGSVTRHRQRRGCSARSCRTPLGRG